MKLKPLDDRVVVEPLEEKSTGSIIIPDTAKEKPQMGKVIAVGTDKDLKKLVKVGQKVIYGKYGGTEFELKGKKYIILSRPDILAIIQ